MSAIIVNSLAQAIAALRAAAELGRPVILWSPPSAAQSLGTGYILTMVATARQAVPEAEALAVIDCGDAPGLALAALRAGAEAVCVAADEPTLAKLADIAGQSGARLVERRPAVHMDLTAIRSDDCASVRAFLLAHPSAI